MKQNTVNIIEAFNIQGRGVITELKHKEEGIPPETVLINPISGDSWVVKKRILSGILLLIESETFFECETEFEHVSSQFKSDDERKAAQVKELEKRNNGIYWYLLKPAVSNQLEKPEPGVSLEIKCTITQ